MFNKRIEEKKKKKKKRTLRPHGRLWYQSSTSATKHSECKMQRQNIEREKKKKNKKNNKIDGSLLLLEGNSFACETPNK